MAEDQPAEDFADALSRVKALPGMDATEEEYDEYWDVLRSLRPFGQVSFDRAVRLLRGRREERVLGCDLLNVLCNPDEESWGPQAARALIEAFDAESETDVLRSLAEALGKAGDPAGFDVLAQLAGHPDEGVRFSVVTAIPACQSHADGEDTSRLAEVLLALMTDEDSDVRDWATFGVGQQLDDDSPEIRAALIQRLDDYDVDTRWEAIVGLARRHDRQALRPMRDALATGAVPFFGVVAAGWIADPSLLPFLASLDAWEGSAALIEAIGRCDPELQQHRIDVMARFLEALSELPHDVLRDAEASLSCPVLEHEVLLTLEVASVGRHDWDFEHLTENRCQGDIALVIESVLRDVNL